MFDFDGTVVDTMHDYAEIASMEMELIFGIKRKTARQLYLETSGEPFFKQLEIIFGANSKNLKCAENYEAKKKKFIKQVTLSDNNRKVLERIRNLGVSTAITSNNFQEIVDNFFINENNLFDIILGFKNGMSKGPEQFNYVIDKFGIDRRYALFVGDSLSDARKALAFGIDFVAISGTLKQESFTSLFPTIPVVQSLEDLYSLIKLNKPLN